MSAVPVPGAPIARELLRQALGLNDPQDLDQWQQQLEPVHLAGGQTLIAQGEPGDALYLVVRGRLRAYLRTGDDPPRALREMGRGEVVGEISLITAAPRTASVVAVRDSTVMRLDRAHFERLVAGSPGAPLTLARQVIQRLQTEHAPPPLPAPVMLALVPVSAGVDGADFARRLADALAAHGRVTVVDAARARDATSPDWLDALEAAHDFVLMVADDGPTDWTGECARHADELLLLADSTVKCPAGTAAWLAPRDLTDHVHLRPALPRDMARLARLINRSAVGLVLAGGGARGFAHLGVLRALHEQGVEIDCVGGTSIGGVMAVMAASDQPPDELYRVGRDAFGLNPTGDVNWLPLVSLLAGRRLRRVVSEAIVGLFSRHVDLEDLWKNCFCVASNFTQAREDVLDRGSALQALLASVAIPGALPPVVRDGDLMSDGGTLNNFPVDVMRRRRGVGTVIGVDLGANQPRKVSFDQVPGNWALLLDRLRPRRRRRYRLPSLPAYLLNTTVLYSLSRRAAAQRQTDVFFNPPLQRVGLLQWGRLDEVSRQGHRHAVEVLARPEVAQRLGLPALGAAAGRPAPSTASSPAAPGSAPRRTQSRPAGST